jgi:alkanesulfonate monooxygenase SsuD/methylene tetrahydromethanopterin reductase-like flavin-dependent oxidoreductase (luciferase family)/uncharacterized glyoxalase superfamily protein PhnB
MPVPSKPLTRLGFLTIGLFDGADPRPGHESTLEIIQLGERLGFDSAWVRHRHLQYGISSPVAILAAATQRTSRIELGTAVTPLGWENPLRLAEDFATVDILSGGRLNPGISVGPPMRWDEVKSALYPDTADIEDFSYERVLRLLRWIRGEPATEFSGVEGIEVFSDRVQPHSPGLAGRLWYGGASLRSAKWAGENRMNLLASSVVKAEESERFAEIQLSHIRTFRAHHPDGDRARVSQGLVVIPTDSASAEQREKYLRYAESRTPAHRESARRGAVDVRGRSCRHVRRDRRNAVHARRLPRSRRGRVRAAVQFRARRLRADPHRHRHEARPGTRLAPGRLTAQGWRPCLTAAGRRSIRGAWAQNQLARSHRPWSTLRSTPASDGGAGGTPRSRLVLPRVPADNGRTSHRPKGSTFMPTLLNPYLGFRDSAKEAMEFYQSVFGGELTLSTFGEFHASEDPAEQDKIMHGMLTSPSGLVLMGADTPNSMEYTPGDVFSVSLSGDDEAELTGYWNQLSEGATITAPLNKAPWGDTFGMCKDKFGINWLVNISGAPA